MIMITVMVVIVVEDLHGTEEHVIKVINNDNDNGNSSDSSKRSTWH